MNGECARGDNSTDFCLCDALFSLSLPPSLSLSLFLDISLSLLASRADAVLSGARGAAAGGKGVERSSSLQRIASAGTLAAGPKATLGDGTASPAIGEDSPRGFVPFRSLQSYENLLSLQAQTR